MRPYFLNAAVMLGEGKEIHGLGRLGDLAGIPRPPSTRYGRSTVTTSHKKLLELLVDSGIAVIYREGCFVPDLQGYVDEHRIVVRLNPEMWEEQP